MFYVKAKVLAGARKESMKKTKEKYFEISVHEPAERNMANERVIEMIADYFGVPRGKVRIINGHRHPSKLLVIEE